MSDITQLMISTVSNPNIPYKLVLYKRPEKYTFDTLPDLLLPAVKYVHPRLHLPHLVEAARKQAEVKPPPEVTQLHFRIVEQENAGKLVPTDYPVACNNLVDGIDFELRMPHVVRSFRNTRLMLYDTSTNGVMVDTKDSRGNEIKVQPLQTKGVIAHLILMATFRYSKIQSSVHARRTPQGEYGESFFSINPGNRIQLVSLSSAMYEAMKEKKDPALVCSAQFHGRTQNFIIRHPCIQLDTVFTHDELTVFLEETFNDYDRALHTLGAYIPDKGSIRFNPHRQ